MKLSASQWCKIQEMLVNLSCPSCLKSKVKLTENKEGNASCEDCGCKFELNPDLHNIITE